MKWTTNGQSIHWLPISMEHSAAKYIFFHMDVSRDSFDSIESIKNISFTQLTSHLIGIDQTWNLFYVMCSHNDAMSFNVARASMK